MKEGGDYFIEVLSLKEPNVAINVNAQGKNISEVVQMLLEAAASLSELHEVEVNISKAFKGAAFVG